MRSVPSQRAQFSAVILLVDDNPDGVLARSSVLSELGYQVVTAGSGPEALVLLESRSVDLAITDFKMNGMNGVELIAQLRERRCEFPIILLTGFAEALGLRPESTGADVVLQKSANELSNLLRHAKRLLHPPRKPARSHLGSSARAQSKTAGE